MNSVIDIVTNLCPDFDFDTKLLRETSDSSIWYKIIWSGEKSTMYTPAYNYIRMHLSEVEKLSEALRNYNVGVKPEDTQWESHQLYHIDIQFAEQAITVLKNLSTWPEGSLIACDIETCHTGWDPKTNRILAIGFAYSSHNSITISDSAFSEEVVQMLRELLESSRFRWIWYNGKFDTMRLRMYMNINARVDEDTMLLHYIGINEKRGTHGLKHLGPLYLMAPQWDDVLDDYKKKWCSSNKIKLEDFTYDLIPRSILIPYLSLDCLATFRLFEVFMRVARPESFRIYRKLIEAAYSYGMIELYGIKTDEEYLQKLHIDLSEELEQAEDTLDITSKKYWDPTLYMRESGAKSYPGKFFNHNSPAQLKWLLGKILGEPLTDTRAETLEALAESYPNNDFITAISAVRTINKQMDTYVTGIRKATLDDGRVHCSFNLHGTETGRLSSSEPNMHNIPRDPKIKNIFKASPGKIFVELDYSQAELRVLAYLSKDPWLTSVYKEGRDLHDAVALKMFGEGFTKEQRVMAKTINFGIAYGRGPGNIASVFNIPIYEAKCIIADWFKPMPKVKEWMQNIRKAALKGESFVTVFGRTRHFVITYENRDSVEREAVNFPIQSIASDLTLMSLIEIEKHHEIDFHIVNTVHDSILIECTDNPETIAAVFKLGTSIMAEMPAKMLPDCEVPFKADAKTGYSWGALHDYKEE